MEKLSPKLDWSLANPKWAATLNPVLANPLLRGQQIDGIVLFSGTPYTFSHQLGQLPQGWFVVDSNAAANIYRPSGYPWSQSIITLKSDADVTISIWVY